jgi:hypothetical protein
MNRIFKEHIKNYAIFPNNPCIHYCSVYAIKNNRTPVYLRVAVLHKIPLNVCRRLLFLYDFNQTWILSTEFGKNVVSVKFHENSSSGSRLFYADGRTDITKLIAAFRISIASAPRTTVMMLLCLLVFEKTNELAA